MLPSILAKQIETGLGDYIETTYPMSNEPFKGSIRNMLNTKDSVYHEPYIAVKLPFRVADSMPACFDAVQPEFLPYLHQQKAFDRLTGDDGRSTLIATGTGSGKTECFLYPILEYCYKHRGEPGIKALIIYPMNALATDQAKRIAELIYQNPKLRGNVTAGMYVGGQESSPSRMMGEKTLITDHETMRNNPPDILLTNYKMLDYLLIRNKDAVLWQENGPEALKYIAVDEMHTFDGAQGTDLACLLRRLKSRLYIQPGYLCCIGTSATMGSEESSEKIIQFASEVFGEDFEPDSIITEDRLTSSEFFAGTEITDFKLPTNEEIEQLKKYTNDDNVDEYIKKAFTSWISDADYDVLSSEGRIQLSKSLLQHSFMQSVINITGNNYFQGTQVIEQLMNNYPDLKYISDKEALIDSLYALISHARIGNEEKLRPFLNVQVQLWIRELRRVLGKVTDKDEEYSIAADLNSFQIKKYLPVVNCRDCGQTGWVTIINPNNNATMTNLLGFYNKFFKADDTIAFLYPTKEEAPSGMIDGHICPEDLKVHLGKSNGECDECGTKMVHVAITSANTRKVGEHKSFVCPFCGSRRGLSLLGARSATQISATLSQMMNSKFNDDKKTMAFSDSVQDAAHRAGFFNSRTWRFGLRSAMQRFCLEKGNELSLQDFQKKFIEYWHTKMSDEDFIGYFIAPNMMWMRAYEDMIKNKKLGVDSYAHDLMTDVEKRIQYEIMLEYGLGNNIGRTLRNSGASTLTFDAKSVYQVIENVKERIINEVGRFDVSDDAYKHFVIGYLELLRSNGAFNHGDYATFLDKMGSSYLISNKFKSWMPGLSERNVPKFVMKPTGFVKASDNFDYVSSTKYTEWISKCVPDSLLLQVNELESISKIIFEELEKEKIIVSIHSSMGYDVYAIDRDKVFITKDTTCYTCDSCGHNSIVSEEEIDFWKGAPCIRTKCLGTFEENGTMSNYYSRLYSNGDMTRINAREHTGLLQRDDREELENEFKNKEEKHVWDPNVLSCTPTLEMGIDIGDLSSVILCSMPPAQSQFIQRAGRAGRKDGNAITLAVANARPHDLYFYADPLDMISGEVTPPKIFLRASAVLERQFVAFCMDSWIKKGISDTAIPKNVGYVLKRLDTKSNDLFPYNFLNYIQSTLTRQLNSFNRMFEQYFDQSTRDDLKRFARGNGMSSSPLSLKILGVFNGLKKESDSIQESIDTLSGLIKDMEAKPKDSAYDEEIKELKSEQAALISVQKEINNKNIYNFLSDEGLLPNYAFPEAGIVLRAILTRKEENKEGEEKDKQTYKKIVYEYNRAASSAISEFAPNNNFYAGGRKLMIDQIDITSAQSAKWRLCPNCSHAQIEEAGKDVASCPQCGSPAWADAGQLRNMLKVHMVYSNADYTKTLIGDDSDDRARTFYTKQLLVDVDEEHDIQSAFSMNNKEFAFGYEFVKKATLREINFGEADTSGNKMTVSGVEDVRKGFRICKHCGKIQPDKGKAIHAYSCKTRKFKDLADSSFEECLFLYREFQTEILRLLIPATTMDVSSEKTESFVAAFMLGMKEYFGNVDHLKATISEVPVADLGTRKKYLVIYDSVPGGTGYLKELMNDNNSLITIFEKALAKMENCTCHEDSQKNGCYHCLYAYRQSQSIGEISRDTATRLLRTILSGKDNLQRIKKLGNVPVNGLFDSELEAKFIEALSSSSKKDKWIIDVPKDLVNNKPGYILKVNDNTYEIEPQVDLDMEDGVIVKCRPDFIIRPLNTPNHKPIAIFTDGFTYHNDIVDDDTLKREAIRRSGKYRVWSLSYKDVQHVFQSQGNYYSNTLNYNMMPSNSMFKDMIRDDVSIHPDKMTSFELLISYLALPNPEEVFKKYANAYSWSLVDTKNIKNSLLFNEYKSAYDKVDNATKFVGKSKSFGTTIFGQWSARATNKLLDIYAGLDYVAYKADKTTPIEVFCILNDVKEERNDKYDEEWNGMWLFTNIMQFHDKFISVSKVGLENDVYTPLAIHALTDDILVTTNVVDDSAWTQVYEALLDESTIEFAKKLEGLGIRIPDLIGADIENDDEVITTVELGWEQEKICLLIDEYLDDKEKLEQLGWTVLELSAGVDVELFGGQ